MIDKSYLSCTKTHSSEIL